MRYRFARAADLKTLQSWVAPEFKDNRRVQDSLVDIWQMLIADGRIRISVLEDQEQPPDRSVQMIGAVGFASDDFVRAYLAAPHPGLAAEIYERVLAGQSPLLSYREISKANSGEGLNLVMLQFALRNPDLEDPQVQQLMVAVNAAFFFFHGGYLLKSAIQEVFRRQAAEYMKAGGFHIVCDFSAGQATSVHDTGSYLLLLHKDQVQPSVVNPLSFLFYPVTPRIHFSGAEQKVLELALLNESDLEISQDMGVSVDAVKKTWRRAYQRAARSAPHLLGSGEEIDGSSSRGVEKRRHLLEYVRIHLEELRPHSP